MNLDIKFDLKKLRNAFVMPIQGKNDKVECVCIPVTEFFKGKNGELYCSLTATERSTPSQYGDTHVIKQQYNREEYKALTDEQKKSIPILGSIKPIQFKNSNSNSSQSSGANIPQSNEPPF